MNSALNLFTLFLFLFPALAQAEPKDFAIVLSGGGDRDGNHVRYENNVRVFTNVLEERGFDKSQMKVLFHRGAESEVADPNSRNEHPDPAFNVPSAFVNTFRKTHISDIIDGPATLKEVRATFAKAEADVKAGATKKVVLFTTDHGTSNTNNFSESSITLADDELLRFGEQEQFVKNVSEAGGKTILIGAQCYSGHNMQIALKQKNTCAFSAASPQEMSIALGPEVAEIKKPIGKLSYSSYAYFFSCALHKPGATDNQAEQDCDPADADANNDGKVTLAEAHLYAARRIDPTSVPQISSQVYAQSLFENRLLVDPEMGANLGSCLGVQNSINELSSQLGKLFEPALDERVRYRLSIQRAVIADFLKDPILMKQLKVKPEADLPAKLKRLVEENDREEKGYEKLTAEMRKVLNDRNQARRQREAMRESIINDLLKANGNGLAEARTKMESAAAAVTDPALSPAKRQMAQNEHNRAKKFIDNLVDNELKKPVLAKKYDAIQEEITKLQKKGNQIEDKLGEQRIDGARIRSTYQAYQSYQAQLAVLGQGTPEQKAKLVELYECENETL